MTNKKKALIIAHSRYQDDEFLYPFYALQEHGFDVTFVSDKIGVVYGDMGTKATANDETGNFEKEDVRTKYLNDFELLVIIGGVKNLEKLRRQKGVLEFVRQWNKRDKTIFTICNGAQLLISANILSGRTVTGYYSIDTDIINAGGIYPKENVFIDKNIVSCNYYSFMGEWLRKGFSHHEIRKDDHLLTNNA